MNACELAERPSNPTSCIVSLPGAACAVSSAVNPVPVNIGSTGPGCPPRKQLGRPLQPQPPMISY